MNHIKLFLHQFFSGFHKKNGLFKKPSPIVKIKNENPYSRVVNMQNVVIDNPTKWYEKKGFLIGVGLLGGIVIMK